MIGWGYNAHSLHSGFRSPFAFMHLPWVGLTTLGQPLGRDATASRPFAERSSIAGQVIGPTTSVRPRTPRRGAPTQDMPHHPSRSPVSLCARLLVGLTTLGQPRLSEGAQPYPRQVDAMSSHPYPIPPPATRGCHPPSYLCFAACQRASMSPRGLRPRLLRSSSPCQQFPAVRLTWPESRSTYTTPRCATGRHPTWP